MARFRAIITSDRGEVSRLSHRQIKTSTDGWNIGVDVCLLRNSEQDDYATIRLTGGSSVSKVPCLTVTYAESSGKLYINGYEFDPDKWIETNKDAQGV